VTFPASFASGWNLDPYGSSDPPPLRHERDSEPETHVRCRICHKWYQAITYTHLRYKHGIEDPKAYKEEFALDKITARDIRRKIAEKKLLVDQHAVDYIRRHWKRQSLKEITSYLGINASTVRAHALRLGLGLRVEKWTGKKVLSALRRARRQGLPLSSGEARKSMARLYKAAISHFHSWKLALTKAGIPYEKVARRAPFETWTEDRIFNKAHALKQQGKERDYHYLQEHHSKLYAAARNHFGSWTAMLRAAAVSEQT